MNAEKIIALAFLFWGLAAAGVGVSLVINTVFCCLRERADRRALGLRWPVNERVRL